MKNLLSELKVLNSDAGWYIGRTVVLDGEENPYSRDSDYYTSKEAAERDLKSESYVQRSHV